MIQRSVCTTDRLTDRDRNGSMAATRNVSVWTPKPDTTAVDRGSISYDLFDKNVVKMHSSNIEFLNYQNDFCQGLLVNLKLSINDIFACMSK